MSDKNRGAVSQSSKRWGVGDAPTEPSAAPDNSFSQQLQERQVVATTFANLELANTKKALAQFVDLYEMLKKENERLTKDLKERDLDSLQVLEYLRLEVAQKTTKLDELERELKTSNEHHDAALRDVTTRLTSIIQDKDVQITKATNTIAALQKELEDLSLFSRERQEILLELDRSKEAYEVMMNKYERELTKLRFQTIEEKVKLKAAETEMVKKFNVEVDARATILVDVKAKSIHENNKNLVHDKTLLEKEVSDLVTLATEVQAELKEAQRSAELDARIQQEAMRHTAKLNKVARESDAKAQMHEARYRNLSAEFDAVLARERRESEQKIYHLQATINQLQKTVELHHHELIRMRSLAGAVVEQRSDLENFFYQALDDVRAMSRTQSAVSKTQKRPETLPSVTYSRMESGHWYALTARTGGRSFSSTPISQRESRDVRSGEERLTVMSSPRVRGTPHTDMRQRILPSPRDVALRSGVTPHSAQQGPFVSSSKTGDPEEAVPIPSLKEDKDGEVLEQQAVDSASFAALTWGEKELIIRSLLFYMNQSFYRRTTPSALTTPLLPSQMLNRDSGESAADAPEIRRGHTARSGGDGVPPLAPRAPLLPSPRLLKSRSDQV